MTQERVRDVLDRATHFYAQLSEYYDGLSAVADRERAKILLEYLSEFENRHVQALAEYEELAEDSVLNTWFKYGGEHATSKCFASPQPTPDMDVDTILREALRFDQCLSDLYQEIVDRAQSDRIKELFATLLASNKKDMRDLVRDCGHLHDW